MKQINYLFSALLLLAILALPTASAWATTAGSAANTEIINTAKLYSGGVLIGSGTVTVTVALIPSQPNVSITHASDTYTGANTPAVTDSVVILSTANGPAQYTVTPSVSASNNTTAPSVSTPPTTVWIGASITTGTSGTTTLTVPCFPIPVGNATLVANNTANATNGQINGIGVGDTIVFYADGSNQTRQVTAVNNPATQGGTAIITFGGTPLTTPPAAGIPVYEQSTVNLSVLPGTVVTSGPSTPIKVDVQAIVSTASVANVTVDTSSPAAGLTTPNIWSTPSLTVNVTKYVRNASPGAAGVAGNLNGVGATTLTWTDPVGPTAHSATYYTDKVTAKAGDILEYVVVATNNGTDASYNLNSSYLADLIPTAFATFFLSQYGAVGKDIWYIDPAGTEAALNADGSGKASYIAANNPNLVVNVGTGAGVGTPGVLAFGKNVKIFYQVTVK